MNLEVVQAVYDLDLCSAQPVQLGDHEFVFGFQHRQTRLELMAVLHWCPTADDLIEDIGAS